MESRTGGYEGVLSGTAELRTTEDDYPKVETRANLGSHRMRKGLKKIEVQPTSIVMPLGEFERR